MSNYSIVVHGGAGPDSDFIKEHVSEYEAGLKAALEAGNKMLENGGSAVDAVEAAIISLEDNYLFNAGRGSSLNHRGEPEMDASIMEGKELMSGAVSMLKNVRNPIKLSRFIMEKTSYVFLSDSGALEMAKDEDLDLEPESYFVTDHQMKEFLEARNKDELQDILQKRIHGTVGAVALDKNGNLAAATSTGGTNNAHAGRIGDSCVIGAGCYANNSVCAISGTGDGEHLINNVVAHTIAMYMELTKCSLSEACDLVIHQRLKDVDGDIGVIGVDPQGNVCMTFNSDRMHRAAMVNGEIREIRVYK